MDELKLLAREITIRLDKSATDRGLACGRANVHAPEYAFVSSFQALLDGEAGNADQLCIAARAEHIGTAKPIREPTQRLCILALKSATERFRARLEGLLPNMPIRTASTCARRRISMLSVIIIRPLQPELGIIPHMSPPT